MSFYQQHYGTTKQLVQKSNPNTYSAMVSLQILMSSFGISSTLEFKYTYRIYMMMETTNSKATKSRQKALCFLFFQRVLTLPFLRLQEACSMFKMEQILNMLPMPHFWR
eukprot:Gb_21464 [translate_table: standard]